MLSSLKKNILIALIGTLTFVNGCLASKKVFVAVTQYTSHSALDAVREGVRDRISQYTKENRLELHWVFENAHGNIATATQIAHKFAGLHPDVIVTIATPSAQTMLAATRNTDIPIVFAAVTDPIAAKLVKSLKKPGGRVTGTYDFPPISRQLDLLEELVPDAKTIGFLFNPGEVNSVKQLEEFKKEALKKKLIVVEGPVLKSTEVIPSALKLINKVDALYIPQDNMVVSSLPGLARLALQHGRPVIAPDPEGVKVGALATIGFSHFAEGQDCGEIAVCILKGENPGNIPVQQPQDMKVYVNFKALKTLHLKIPEKLKTKNLVVY